jgi:hypothetical protein
LDLAVDHAADDRHSDVVGPHRLGDWPGLDGQH